MRSFPTRHNCQKIGIWFIRNALFCVQLILQSSHFASPKLFLAMQLLLWRIPSFFLSQKTLECDCWKTARLIILARLDARLMWWFLKGCKKAAFCCVASPARGDVHCQGYFCCIQSWKWKLLHVTLTVVLQTHFEKVWSSWIYFRAIWSHLPAASSGLFCPFCCPFFLIAF